MAYALHVDKLDDDGLIRVRHTFYGDTEEECEALRDKHGAGCVAFGPALKADRIIETCEEIEEIPEWEDEEDET